MAHRKRKENLIWKSMKTTMSFLHGIVDWRCFGFIGRHFLRAGIRKKLRSDIKEKSSEFLKDVKEIYDDSSTKAKDIIEEAEAPVKR